MTISETEQELFISWAQQILETEVISEREPHGDEGVVYRLQTPKEKFFLKLKSNSDFSSESQRLRWLRDKLPVPEVIASTQNGGVGALLLSAIEGKNLAALCKQWPAERVMDELVRVLHLFHATDPQDWPYEKMKEGLVLVHGDACLPNFIFSEDRFGGYIDLGEAALGSVEIDLRAAIWSLQYNLGKSYGLSFLEKYGYSNATEKRVEELHFEYEDYQKAHGFLS